MGAGSLSQYLKLTRHITDVVKVDEENIIFDWVLLDFDAWLTSEAYDTKSSIFQGAQRLGRKSHWYLRLSRETYDPDFITVGIYLHSADPVVDRPKDIRARVALFLLDSHLKEARSFGKSSLYHNFQHESIISMHLNIPGALFSLFTI